MANSIVYLCAACHAVGLLSHGFPSPFVACESLDEVHTEGTHNASKQATQAKLIDALMQNRMASANLGLFYVNQGERDWPNMLNKGDVDASMLPGRITCGT